MRVDKDFSFFFTGPKPDQNMSLKFVCMFGEGIFEGKRIRVWCREWNII